MKYIAPFAAMALAASTSASVFPRSAKLASKSGIEQREIQSSDHVEAANPCFAPIFALSAGAFAGMFWYDAAGTCPASASPDNINHAQCGLSATLGTTFTLITGFSVAGMITKGVTTRDVNSTGLYVDPDVIEGYSTKLVRAGPELDDLYSGHDGWVHHYVEHTDLSGTGNNLSTILSMHESGRRRVAADVPQTDDNDLQKRAGYTVYYSWDDGDTADFSGQNICQTSDAAQDLAEALYNYGHSTNQGHFCANLMGSGGVRLTQGDFAVVPTGTFTSYASQCP